MNAAIKRNTILFATFALGFAMAPAAEFAKSLSKAESQSAGLAKLTPAEIASLETLIQRYKQGAVAVVQQQAEKKQQEAEQKVVAAEAKAAAVTKPEKKFPAWVGALITLQRTGDQPDKAETLESRLTGNFSGWSGRSTFRLENGQLWAQANSDSYEYAPTLHTPAVKITPASMGTFWLEISGVHHRCRVKPLKME